MPCEMSPSCDGQVGFHSRAVPDAVWFDVNKAECERAPNFALLLGWYISSLARRWASGPHADLHLDDPSATTRNGLPYPCAFGGRVGVDLPGRAARAAVKRGAVDSPNHDSAAHHRITGTA